MHSLGARLTVAAAVAVAVVMPAAMVGVLVVGNVDWLYQLDATVTSSFHRFALDHPGWVWFMKAWSLVFDPNTWRVAAVGLVIWLVRRKETGLAWWVAITMAVGGLLGVLLKLMVSRHRPALLDPVARATGYSFPSGHALNNALGAAVLLLLLLPYTRGKPRWRAALWAGAIGIPLITAMSRVALGVHWTSDVVAGLFVGVAVAAITAATYLARDARMKDSLSG
ncbi:phosphatase PAP2 family protein [Paractinoplanes toevensis]|uniref:Phosphatase PAP2 family protein n=1 Tax=Paractinoplanes toevensis TaxID=571911 RepID=A0A919TED3_9ACTN|nr:phosphatase PAP2 family protein [Actinoplanes toevensis]GIM93898.1 phosphatase PAP2 family protein [Actinoplanes toevensis]